MEVDILEFLVPVENNKTLLVWDIQPSHTEDQVCDGLFHVFSSFGPLYLLEVCPNASPGPPGFYSLIKFYSAAQASRAQRQTDGRLLLTLELAAQGTNNFIIPSRGKLLSSSSSSRVGTHCNGSGGSDTAVLKELTSEEEEEEEGGVRCRRLKFGCLLQLSFPHHRQMTRAAAVVEDSYVSAGVCVSELVCVCAGAVRQKRCKLQKLVRERALVQALTTVLLILLGDTLLLIRSSAVEAVSC
uniref:DM1 domain-containing protein n=1 Tax=Mola mola TaxID=94237 RepID=A0A3Q3VSW3_MOLML